MLSARVLAAALLAIPSAASAQSSEAARPPVASPTPEASAAAAPRALAPASSATDVMTPMGFSGGVLTPGARTLPWGTFGLRYDPQMPGARDVRGHNYVIGVGVLPYVEAAGRIAANDLHCNLYLLSTCDSQPQLRDLSMSFKVAVPLDAQERFSVALGATDLGGAATNFRSFYGAFGWRQGPFDLTVGAGRADNGGALLGGLFGRVAVQVLPVLQLSAERIPDGNYLSARAFVPVGWLPDRWHAFVDFTRRIGDGTATGSSWFAAGLNIPLDFVGTGATVAAQRRAAERAPVPLFGGGAAARAATSGAAPTVATSAAVDAPVGLPVLDGRPAAAPIPALSATPPAATGRIALASADAAAAAGATSALASDAGGPPGRADAARLARLAGALSDAGVEDVSVGERPRADGGATVVVRADNAGFRWNDLDALGVVLARTARVLAPVDAAFLIVLGRRGIPTLQVEGTAECLAAFLRTGAADCSRGDTPRMRGSGEAGFDSAMADVVWAHTGVNPSWGKTRVTIGPGLRSAVATEYGVFDYSLAAEVTVEVPLWRGASIEARRSFPISHSDDYGDGRVFGADRHRTVTDRVLLHQAVPLGAGVTARAAVGRIFDDWQGGLGEVRWQPGDGTHRVGLSAGQFRNDGSLRAGFTAEPALLSYRYLVAPLDWQLELTAGRFFLNDTGWMVVSRHWFGDVSVEAYVRSTAHPNQPEPVRFAGLQIALPLTPRREMDTRWLRIQGYARWAYGIESVVGRQQNLLTGGHGVIPPVPSELDTIHNHDRAAPAYSRRHWARVREAAQRYGGPADEAR